MLSRTLKVVLSQAAPQRAAMSTKTMAQVRAKRIALQSIQNPKAFLEEVKTKGAGQNELASANLLHLLTRTTGPADLHIATKAIALYQRKGCDFNHRFCSYFINLCAQADQPKVVADLLVKPEHRLGAWVSKKGMLTLMKSLAKTTDVESMLNVANSVISKGVSVQTRLSLGVLMRAVHKSRSAEHYAAAIKVASHSIPESALDAFKAKYPPRAEEVKASE